MDSLSGAPSSQAPVADVSQPKNRTLQQSQLNSLTADLGQPSGNASPTIQPMGQGSQGPGYELGTGFHLPSGSQFLSPGGGGRAPGQGITQGQTPFGGFGTATSWPQSLINLLGGMASQWAPQNQSPGSQGMSNGPASLGWQDGFGYPFMSDLSKHNTPEQNAARIARGESQGTPQLGGPWGNAITPPQGMQTAPDPRYDQVGTPQDPFPAGAANPFGASPGTQQPPPQPPIPQQAPQAASQPPPLAAHQLPQAQIQSLQSRTPNGTPTPQSMGYGPNYQDSPADQAARRTVQAQQSEREAAFMRESELAAQRGQDLYNTQLTGGNAYTSPYGANPNELNQMAALGMNLPSANNPAYWQSLGVQAPSYLSNYYTPIAGDQFNSGVNVAPTANGGAAGTTAAPINPVITNGPVALPPMPPASDNPYATNAPNSPFLDPNWGALNVQGTPELGQAFNTVQDQLNSGLINWNTQFG